MNGQEIQIPLDPLFRFMAEPLCFETDEDKTKSLKRMIPRSRQHDRLRDRIHYSDGGTFLITGYRGTGKTSFINDVLRAVQDVEGSSTDVIGIRLNLAKAVSERRLMHQLIRKLYWEIVGHRPQQAPRKQGQFPDLGDFGVDVQKDLKLAYWRTVFDMTFNLARGTKTTGKADIGLELPNLFKQVGKFGLSLGREKSYEKGHQIALLDYDDFQAEDDLIRLSKAIADFGVFQDEAHAPRGIVDKLTDTLRGIVGKKATTPRKRLKVVFVFDEMDKIDDDDFVYSIFKALKNVLTAAKFHFVFIVDEQFSGKWREGIYRSVFADEVYLPRMWQSADEFCAKVVKESEIAEQDRDVYENFKKYLSYRGRGIIRDTVREFERLVQWREDTPYLVLDKLACAGIAVYAPPQELIRREHGAILRDAVSRVEEQPQTKDRLGLRMYRMVDVIIEHLHDGFSETELSTKMDEKFGVFGFDPQVRANLLEKMCEDGMLNLVDGVYRLDAEWQEAIEKRIGLVQQLEEDADRLRKLERLIGDARKAREALEAIPDEKIEDSLENYASMVEAYDLVFKQDEINLLSEVERSSLHLEFARALDPQQDASKTDEQFSEALRLDPERQEILYEYARFLLWSDRAEEALPFLQKLISRDPPEEWVGEAFSIVQALWRYDAWDSAEVLMKFVTNLSTKYNQAEATKYDLLYDALRLAIEPNESTRLGIIQKAQTLKPDQRELVQKALDYQDMTVTEKRDLGTLLGRTDIGEIDRFLLKVLRREK